MSTWRWWPIGLPVCGILLLATSSGAGTLDLSWTAPATNTDGSPLTDLWAYAVYYGISHPPCPGTSSFQVPSLTPNPPAPELVTLRLTGLLSGTRYYVSVTAVDASGNESACSTPVASDVARSELAVSPTDTVDFGSVNLGSFAEQTLTVQNAVGGTVSGAVAATAPFSVVSGSPLHGDVHGHHVCRHDGERNVCGDPPHGAPPHRRHRDARDVDDRHSLSLCL